LFSLAYPNPPACRTLFSQQPTNQALKRQSDRDPEKENGWFGGKSCTRIATFRMPVPHCGESLAAHGWARSSARDDRQTAPSAFHVPSLFEHP